MSEIDPEDFVTQALREFMEREPEPIKSGPTIVYIGAGLFARCQELGFDMTGYAIPQPMAIDPTAKAYKIVHNVGNVPFYRRLPKPKRGKK